MNPTQLELAASPAPMADSEQPWLERWLLDNPGWHKVPEIEAASGLRLNYRSIGYAAAASAEIISGARGYRHLRHAKPEEINHFLAGLGSRIRELARRKIRVQRRAHQLVG